MKKTISFQLDDALIVRLDEAVRQGNGNRSEVLRRMIEKVLEDRPLPRRCFNAKRRCPDALLGAFGKGR